MLTHRHGIERAKKHCWINRCLIRLLLGAVFSNQNHHKILCSNPELLPETFSRCCSDWLPIDWFCRKNDRVEKLYFSWHQPNGISIAVQVAAFVAGDHLAEHAVVLSLPLELSRFVTDDGLVGELR